MSPEGVLAAVSFLDMVGVGMLVPLLPTLYKSLDASTTTIGLLTSVYGGANLIGGPAFGRLTDSVGARTALAIAMVGSACGYALVSLTRSLWVMALARLITGIFKQSLTIAKGALANITSESDRASSMGRIQAAASSGFIVGPVLGGYLSSVAGVHGIAVATAVIFLLNAVLAWYALHLPAQSAEEQHKSERKSDKPAEGMLATVWHYSLGSLHHSLKQIAAIGQSELIAVQLGSNLAIVTLRSIFSTYMDKEFSPSSQTMGMMLSFQGVLGAASSFMVGPMVFMLGGEEMSILPMMVVQLLCYLVLFSTSSLVWFTTISIPLRFAGSVFSAVCTSIITKAASKDNAASAVAGSEIIFSISRTVAPTLAGIALDIHPMALSFLCASMVGLGAVPWLMGGKHKQDKQD